MAPLRPFTVLLLGLTCLSAMANNTSPCRDDDRFRQFDFWLGSWEVRQREDNRLAGYNEITVSQNGCLIEEHWRSVNGGTGFSMNIFNPVSGQWRQVWVADGYSIDYRGGLRADGSMRLEGKLYNYRDGTASDFRGTWIPGKDGTIRQLFEIRPGDEGDDGWAVWFDGIYRPVGSHRGAREGPP